MLRELRTLGYTVTADGRELSVEGPPLTDELRVRIKGNKGLILNELAQERLVIVAKPMTEEEQRIEAFVAAVWPSEAPNYEEALQEYEDLDDEMKAEVLAGFDQITGIRTPADYWFVLKCDAARDAVYAAAEAIVRGEV